LSGEAVQIVLPVVLYEWSGRKYILDGHHRWSRVHALNSAGKIKAIVLTSNKPMSPLRMLAVLQLAIAAATDGVPSSSAGKKETNLLLATSNDATAAYVQASMSDAFVELYNATLGTNQTRETIGAHVMRSIAIMQLTSPRRGRRFARPHAADRRHERAQEGPMANPTGGREDQLRGIENKEESAALSHSDPQRVRLTKTIPRVLARGFSPSVLRPQ
jgi:hypothetical protein